MLIVRYGLERLLYRFEAAGHIDTFVLKGAILFALWQDIPGTVELEPVEDKDFVYYALLNDGEKEFKPYYVAHTKIETLALLEEKDQGSNWLQWWRRLQPIRTASLIQANIKILPATDIPLYQQLSEKAARLKLLGMNYADIAKRLGVDSKTARKACLWGGRGG